MEYPIPIPEEVKALLTVRVNHDLEDSDSGMWIASVSVYKALRFQQQRIVDLEQQLVNRAPVCQSEKATAKYPIPEDLKDRHDKLMRQSKGSRGQRVYASILLPLIERIARLEHELAEANAEIIRINQQIEELSCLKK